MFVLPTVLEDSESTNSQGTSVLFSYEFSLAAYAVYLAMEFKMLRYN